MRVLVLIDRFWSPIATDVILIPEGKTPEEAYVNFVRKYASDKTCIDYDEEEDARIKAMTDEDIVNECEYSWDITTVIGWNLEGKEEKELQEERELLDE